MTKGDLAGRRALAKSPWRPSRDQLATTQVCCCYEVQAAVYSYASAVGPT